MLVILKLIFLLKYFLLPKTVGPYPTNVLHGAGQERKHMLSAWRAGKTRSQEQGAGSEVGKGFVP